jgi:hypothetical protein
MNLILMCPTLTPFPSIAISLPMAQSPPHGGAQSARFHGREGTGYKYSGFRRVDIPWEHLSLIYGGEGGDVNGLPPDRSASPPHVKDRFPARAALFLDSRSHSLREQSPMIEEILKGDVSYWDDLQEGSANLGDAQESLTYPGALLDGSSTFGDGEAVEEDTVVTGVTRQTLVATEVASAAGAGTGSGVSSATQGADLEASGAVGSSSTAGAGAPVPAPPPGSGSRPAGAVAGARQPLPPSTRPAANPATSLRTVSGVPSPSLSLPRPFLTPHSSLLFLRLGQLRTLTPSWCTVIVFAPPTCVAE